MEELGHEAKLMAKNMPKEIIEIDTEKINTPSFKSKVNLEKEMTLNLDISENAEAKCSQQSVELVASLPAIVNNDLYSLNYQHGEQTFIVHPNQKELVMSTQQKNGIDLFLCENPIVRV